MKIELLPSVSRRIGFDCTPQSQKVVIETLTLCKDDQLEEELRFFRSWMWDKGDMSIWTTVMNRFDDHLEAYSYKIAVIKDPNTPLPPKRLCNPTLIAEILRVSFCIIEACANRNIYNSLEHVSACIDSFHPVVARRAMRVFSTYYSNCRKSRRSVSDLKAHPNVVFKMNYLCESPLLNFHTSDASIIPQAGSLSTQANKDETLNKLETAAENAAGAVQTPIQSPSNRPRNPPSPVLSSSTTNHMNRSPALSCSNGDLKAGGMTSNRLEDSVEENSNAVLIEDETKLKKMILSPLFVNNNANKNSFFSLEVATSVADFIFDDHNSLISIYKSIKEPADHSNRSKQQEQIQHLGDSWSFTVKLHQLRNINSIPISNTTPLTTSQTTSCFPQIDGVIVSEPSITETVRVTLTSLLNLGFADAIKELLSSASVMMNDVSEDGNLNLNDVNVLKFNFDEDRFVQLQRNLEQVLADNAHKAFIAGPNNLKSTNSSITPSSTAVQLSSPLLTKKSATNSTNKSTVSSTKRTSILNPNNNNNNNKKRQKTDVNTQSPPIAQPPLPLDSSTQTASTSSISSEKWSVTDPYNLRHQLRTALCLMLGGWVQWRSFLVELRLSACSCLLGMSLNSSDVLLKTHPELLPQTNEIVTISSALLQSARSLTNDYALNKLSTTTLAADSDYDQHLLKLRRKLVPTSLLTTIFSYFRCLICERSQPKLWETLLGISSPHGPLPSYFCELVRLVVSMEEFAHDHAPAGSTSNPNISDLVEKPREPWHSLSNDVMKYLSVRMPHCGSTPLEDMIAEVDANIPITRRGSRRSRPSNRSNATKSNTGGDENEDDGIDIPALDLGEEGAQDDIAMDGDFNNNTNSGDDDNDDDGEDDEESSDLLWSSDEEGLDSNNAAINGNLNNENASINPDIIICPAANAVSIGRSRYLPELYSVSECNDILTSILEVCQHLSNLSSGSAAQTLMTAALPLIRVALFLQFLHHPELMDAQVSLYKLVEIVLERSPPAGHALTRFDLLADSVVSRLVFDVRRLLAEGGLVREDEIYLPPRIKHENVNWGSREASLAHPGLFEDRCQTILNNFDRQNGVFSILRTDGKFLTDIRYMQDRCLLMKFSIRLLSWFQEALGMVPVGDDIVHGRIIQGFSLYCVSSIFRHGRAIFGVGVVTEAALLMYETTSDSVFIIEKLVQIGLVNSFYDVMDDFPKLCNRLDELATVHLCEFLLLCTTHKDGLKALSDRDFHPIFPLVDCLHSPASLAAPASECGLHAGNTLGTIAIASSHIRIQIVDYVVRIIDSISVESTTYSSPSKDDVHDDSLFPAALSLRLAPSSPFRPVSLCRARLPMEDPSDSVRMSIVHSIPTWLSPTVPSPTANCSIASLPEFDVTTVKAAAVTFDRLINLSRFIDRVSASIQINKTKSNDFTKLTSRNLVFTRFTRSLSLPSLFSLFEPASPLGASSIVLALSNLRPFVPSKSHPWGEFSEFSGLLAATLMQLRIAVRDAQKLVNNPQLRTSKGAIIAVSRLLNVLNRVHLLSVVGYKCSESQEDLAKFVRPLFHVLDFLMRQVTANENLLARTSPHALFMLQSGQTQASDLAQHQAGAGLPTLHDPSNIRLPGLSSVGGVLQHGAAGNGLLYDGNGSLADAFEGAFRIASPSFAINPIGMISPVIDAVGLIAEERLQPLESDNSNLSMNENIEVDKNQVSDGSCIIGKLIDKAEDAERLRLPIDHIVDFAPTFHVMQNSTCNDDIDAALMSDMESLFTLADQQLNSSNQLNSNINHYFKRDMSYQSLQMQTTLKHFNMSFDSMCSEIATPFLNYSPPSPSQLTTEDKELLNKWDQDLLDAEKDKSEVPAYPTLSFENADAARNSSGNLFASADYLFDEEAEFAAGSIPHHFFMEVVRSTAFAVRNMLASSVRHAQKIPTIKNPLFREMSITIPFADGLTRMIQGLPAHMPMSPVASANHAALATLQKFMPFVTLSVPENLGGRASSVTFSESCSEVRNVSPMWVEASRLASHAGSLAFLALTSDKSECLALSLDVFWSRGLLHLLLHRAFPIVMTVAFVASSVRSAASLQKYDLDLHEVKATGKNSVTAVYVRMSVNEAKKALLLSCGGSDIDEQWFNIALEICEEILDIVSCGAISVKKKENSFNPDEPMVLDGSHLSQLVSRIVQTADPLLQVISRMASCKRIASSSVTHNLIRYHSTHAHRVKLAEYQGALATYNKKLEANLLTEDEKNQGCPTEPSVGYMSFDLERLRESTAISAVEVVAPWWSSIAQGAALGLGSTNVLFATVGGIQPPFHSEIGSAGSVKPAVNLVDDSGLNPVSTLSGLSTNSPTASINRNDKKKNKNKQRNREIASSLSNNVNNTPQNTCVPSLLNHSNFLETSITANCWLSRRVTVTLHPLLNNLSKTIANAIKLYTPARIRVVKKIIDSNMPSHTKPLAGISSLPKRRLAGGPNGLFEGVFDQIFGSLMGRAGHVNDTEIFLGSEGEVHNEAPPRENNASPATGADQNANANGPANANNRVEITDDLVNLVCEVGFEREHARRALVMCNGNPNAAIEILLSNPDAIDYSAYDRATSSQPHAASNAPALNSNAALPSTAATDSLNANDHLLTEESIQLLIEMGFERPTAIHALRKTSGDVEGAASWILSDEGALYEPTDEEKQMALVIPFVPPSTAGEANAADNTQTTNVVDNVLVRPSETLVSSVNPTSRRSNGLPFELDLLFNSVRNGSLNENPSLTAANSNENSATNGQEANIGNDVEMEPYSSVSLTNNVDNKVEEKTASDSVPSVEPVFIPLSDIKLPTFFSSCRFKCDVDENILLPTTSNSKTGSYVYENTDLASLRKIPHLRDLIYVDAENDDVDVNIEARSEGESTDRKQMLSSTTLEAVELKYLRRSLEIPDDVSDAEIAGDDIHILLASLNHNSNVSTSSASFSFTNPDTKEGPILSPPVNNSKSIKQIPSANNNDGNNKKKDQKQLTKLLLNSKSLPNKKTTDKDSKPSPPIKYSTPERVKAYHRILLSTQWSEASRTPRPFLSSCHIVARRFVPFSAHVAVCAFKDATSLTEKVLRDIQSFTSLNWEPEVFNSSTAIPWAPVKHAVKAMIGQWGFWPLLIFLSLLQILKKKMSSNVSSQPASKIELLGSANDDPSFLALAAISPNSDAFILSDALLSTCLLIAQLLDGCKDLLRPSSHLSSSRVDLPTFFKHIHPSGSANCDARVFPLLFANLSFMLRALVLSRERCVSLLQLSRPVPSLLPSPKVPFPLYALMGSMPSLEGEQSMMDYLLCPHALSIPTWGPVAISILDLIATFMNFETEESPSMVFAGPLFHPEGILTASSGADSANVALSEDVLKAQQPVSPAQSSKVAAATPVKTSPHQNNGAASSKRCQKNVRRSRLRHLQREEQEADQQLREAESIGGGLLNPKNPLVGNNAKGNFLTNGFESSNSLRSVDSTFLSSELLVSLSHRGNNNGSNNNNNNPNNVYSSVSNSGKDWSPQDLISKILCLSLVTQCASGQALNGSNLHVLSGDTPRSPSNLTTSKDKDHALLTQELLSFSVTHKGFEIARQHERAAAKTIIDIFHTFPASRHAGIAGIKLLTKLVIRPSIAKLIMEHTPKRLAFELGIENINLDNLLLNNNNSNSSHLNSATCSNGEPVCPAPQFRLGAVPALLGGGVGVILKLARNHKVTGLLRVVTEFFVKLFTTTSAATVVQYQLLTVLLDHMHLFANLQQRTQAPVPSTCLATSTPAVPSRAHHLGRPPVIYYGVNCISTVVTHDAIVSRLSANPQSSWAALMEKTPNAPLGMGHGGRHAPQFAALRKYYHRFAYKHDEKPAWPFALSIESLIYILGVVIDKVPSVAGVIVSPPPQLPQKFLSHHLSPNGSNKYIQAHASMHHASPLSRASATPSSSPLLHSSASPSLPPWLPYPCDPLSPPWLFSSCAVSTHRPLLSFLSRKILPLVISNNDPLLFDNSPLYGSLSTSTLVLAFIPLSPSEAVQSMPSRQTKRIAEATKIVDVISKLYEKSVTIDARRRILLEAVVAVRCLSNSVSMHVLQANSYLSTPQQQQSHLTGGLKDQNLPLNSLDGSDSTLNTPHRHAVTATTTANSARNVTTDGGAIVSNMNILNSAMYLMSLWISQCMAIQSVCPIKKSGKKENSQGTENKKARTDVVSRFTQLLSGGSISQTTFPTAAETSANSNSAESGDVTDKKETIENENDRGAEEDAEAEETKILNEQERAHLRISICHLISVLDLNRDDTVHVASCLIRTLEFLSRPDVSLKAIKMMRDGKKGKKKTSKKVGQIAATLRDLLGNDSVADENDENDVSVDFRQNDESRRNFDIVIEGDEEDDEDEEEDDDDDDTFLYEWDEIIDEDEEDDDEEDEGDNEENQQHARREHRRRDADYDDVDMDDIDEEHSTDDHVMEDSESHSSSYATDDDDEDEGDDFEGEILLDFSDLEGEGDLMEDDENDDEDAQDEDEEEDDEDEGNLLAPPPSRNLVAAAVGARDSDSEDNQMMSNAGFDVIDMDEDEEDDDEDEDSPLPHQALNEDLPGGGWGADENDGGHLLDQEDSVPDEDDEDFGMLDDMEAEMMIPGGRRRNHHHHHHTNRIVDDGVPLQNPHLDEEFVMNGGDDDSDNERTNNNSNNGRNRRFMSATGTLFASPGVRGTLENDEEDNDDIILGSDDDEDAENNFDGDGDFPSDEDNDEEQQHRTHSVHLMNDINLPSGGIINANNNNNNMNREGNEFIFRNLGNFSIDESSLIRSMRRGFNSQSTENRLHHEANDDFLGENNEENDEDELSGDEFLESLLNNEGGADLRNANNRDSNFLSPLNSQSNRNSRLAVNPVGDDEIFDNSSATNNNSLLAQNGPLPGLTSIPLGNGMTLHTSSRRLGLDPPPLIPTRGGENAANAIFNAIQNSRPNANGEIELQIDISSGNLQSAHQFMDALRQSPLLATTVASTASNSHPILGGTNLFRNVHAGGALQAVSTQSYPGDTHLEGRVDYMAMALPDLSVATTGASGSATSCTFVQRFAPQTFQFSIPAGGRDAWTKKPSEAAAAAETANHLNLPPLIESSMVIGIIRLQFMRRIIHRGQFHRILLNLCSTHVNTRVTVVKLLVIVVWASLSRLAIDSSSAHLINTSQQTITTNNKNSKAPVANPLAILLRPQSPSNTTGNGLSILDRLNINSNATLANAANSVLASANRSSINTTMLSSSSLSSFPPASTLHPPSCLPPPSVSVPLSTLASVPTTTSSSPAYCLLLHPPATVACSLPSFDVSKAAAAVKMAERALIQLRSLVDTQPACIEAFSIAGAISPRFIAEVEDIITSNITSQSAMPLPPSPSLVVSADQHGVSTWTSNFASLHPNDRNIQSSNNSNNNNSSPHHSRSVKRAKRANSPPHVSSSTTKMADTNSGGGVSSTSDDISARLAASLSVSAEAPVNVLMHMLSSPLMLSSPQLLDHTVSVIHTLFVGTSSSPWKSIVNSANDAILAEQQNHIRHPHKKRNEPAESSSSNNNNISSSSSVPGKPHSSLETIHQRLLQTLTPLSCWSLCNLMVVADPIEGTPLPHAIVQKLAIVTGRLMRSPSLKTILMESLKKKTKVLCASILEDLDGLQRDLKSTAEKAQVLLRKSETKIEKIQSKFNKTVFARNAAVKSIRETTAKSIALLFAETLANTMLLDRASKVAGLPSRRSPHHSSQINDIDNNNQASNSASNSKNVLLESKWTALDRIIRAIPEILRQSSLDKNSSAKELKKEGNSANNSNPNTNPEKAETENKKSSTTGDSSVVSQTPNVLNEVFAFFTQSQLDSLWQAVDECICIGSLFDPPGPQEASEGPDRGKLAPTSPNFRAASIPGNNSSSNSGGKSTKRNASSKQKSASPRSTTQVADLWRLNGGLETEIESGRADALASSLSNSVSGMGAGAGSSANLNSMIMSLPSAVITNALLPLLGAFLISYQLGIAGAKGLSTPLPPSDLYLTDPLQSIGTDVLQYVQFMSQQRRSREAESSIDAEDFLRSKYAIMSAFLRNSHLKLDEEDHIRNPLSFSIDENYSTELINRVMSVNSFAERHRRAINAIAKSTPQLLSLDLSPLLRICPHLLDFDTKRSYFRAKLRTIRNEGNRFSNLKLNVRRAHVFTDSFSQIMNRKKEELRNKLNVTFSGEEGVDAGGLSREWFGILAKDMFDPNYALFQQCGSKAEFNQPNRLSEVNLEHLQYFTFIGRVLGKALFDSIHVDAFFVRSFYKMLVGRQPATEDMDAIDPDFFKSLKLMESHDIDDLCLELTFSVDEDRFGEKIVFDLVPDGRNISVTNENKFEYIRLLCQYKMMGAIRKQMKSIINGLHDVIPPRILSIFDDKEFELLLSGLPFIDLADLKANTEYHGYNPNSPQVEWFWNLLEEFNQNMLAVFLQFATGSSKVPLGGFKDLVGIRGPQRFQIHKSPGDGDRLPSAHTCVNQLDLPDYENEETLRRKLVMAIQMAREGFAFA